MNGSELIKNEEIQNRIYTIRDVQVMLDMDLAELYDVEVKRLNEQVKRNIERFPESFRFQLTDSDLEFLKSQVVISNDGKNLKSQFATSSWGGRRTKPYVFTEQGVAMLSAVLRSETTVVWERSPIHKCGEAVLWDFVSEVQEPETPKCDTSMRTSLS